MAAGTEVQRRGPGGNRPIGGVFGERQFGLELARQARLDGGIGQERGRGLQLGRHVQPLRVDDHKNFARVLSAEVA